jgi:hypothetical protein
MNYYYAVFFIAPLLALRDRRAEMAVLGASAASAALLVWSRVSASYDTRCYFQSWVYLGLALFLLAPRSSKGATGRRGPG